MILTGCDDGKAPDIASRPASDTTLPGAPDFTSRPGDIPTTDVLSQTGRRFHLRINSNGEILRNDQPTSRSDIINELLAIPDIGNVAVVIEGDSDVLVGNVIELQSYLSDSVPGLGSTTHVVVLESDGG